MMKFATIDSRFDAFYHEKQVVVKLGDTIIGSSPYELEYPPRVGFDGISTDVMEDIAIKIVDYYVGEIR